MPEVWRYDVDAATLWFGRLRADGKYEPVERSAALPMLLRAWVLDVIARGESLTDSRFEELLEGWIRAELNPPRLSDTTAIRRNPTDARNQGPPLLDPEFLHKLEQLELVSRKIFVGRMKGERKSKRRGSSVEFADHRNYTVGDDLRHIDWNVYGRLDKLFLKLFLEEEDLHVYTLLDTSLSMDFGDPTKLHYGKQVAAALAFIGLVNHDRVVLDTFSTGLDERLPERPGPVADVARRPVPRPARGRRARAT